MLCDDIIHAANPASWNKPFGLKSPKGRLREWLDIAAARVKEAQRFAISDDALQVVTHVSQSKPSSLMSGLGIARMPFRHMFIEYDWDARLKLLMEEFGYADQREEKNRRMRFGLLAQATDDTLRRGTLHLFTRYDYFSPTMSPLVIHFDFSAKEDNLVWQKHADKASEFTPEDVLRRAQQVHPQDYSPRFVKSPEETRAMSEMNNIFDIGYDPQAEPHVRHLTEIGNDPRQYIKSWHINMAGEARFFLSIIMLLNSRNLAEIREVSAREVNSTVQRTHPSQRAAIVSHHKVAIRLSKVATNRLRAQGATTSGQIAYHMVRGHWKVRKTGVFFWSPHFAGNKAKGIITKEYDVLP